MALAMRDDACSRSSGSSITSPAPPQTSVDATMGSAVESGQRILVDAYKCFSRWLLTGRTPRDLETQFRDAEAKLHSLCRSASDVDEPSTEYPSEVAGALLAILTVAWESVDVLHAATLADEYLTAVWDNVVESDPSGTAACMVIQQKLADTDEAASTIKRPISSFRPEPAALSLARRNSMPIIRRRLLAQARSSAGGSAW